MGWLRDRWLDANYNSAEQLADYLLRPENWPSGLKGIGARSLGNNLRALDKGQRIGWWRRRRGLVDLLAMAVFCEFEEIEHELFERDSITHEPETQQAELAPLGRIRSLILAREDLPPGIPYVARRSALWSRNWWCTRDQGTPWLVGKWLAARNLAAYIPARSWRDARRRLPPSGRVLVVLEITEADDDFMALATSRVLEGLAVCIAAPFPWSRAQLRPVPGALFTWSAAESSCWSFVEPEPLEGWLPSLVEWAVARIPKKQRPAADEILRIIQSTGVGPFLAGPGDALDFIGLLSATRKRERPGAALDGWARLRIDAEVERRAKRESSKASLLEERADRAVNALLEATLVDPAAIWSRGQSRSTWSNRIPSAVVPAIDAQTAKEVFAHVDDLTSSDRDRLSRALQPKPRDVVDALRDAEILVPCANEKRLRPRACWWIEALYSFSFERILEQGDASRIGQLVLQPHLADRVIESLLRRVGDAGYLARIIGRKARDNSAPELLAASEACAIAIGLARLDNPEFSESLVTAAWRLRDQLAVEAGRIFPSLPLHRVDEPGGMTSDAVFALAMLALCEGAASQQLANDFARRLAKSAADSLIHLAATPTGMKFVPGAARLAYRVAKASGDPDILEKFEDDALFLPAYLFDFASRWKNDPASCADEHEFITFRDIRLPPAALLVGLDALSHEDERSRANVLGCLWHVWNKSGLREELPPLRWIAEDPESAEILWRTGAPNLKRPFLESLFARKMYPEPVTRSFEVGQWRIAIDIGLRLSSDFGSASEYAGFWRAMPERVLTFFLESGPVDPEHRSTIVALGWERIPDKMFELVRTRPIRRVACLLPRDDNEYVDRLLPIVAGKVADVNPGDQTARRLVEWLRAIMSRRTTGYRELLTLQREIAKQGSKYGAL